MISRRSPNAEPPVEGSKSGAGARISLPFAGWLFVAALVVTIMAILLVPEMVKLLGPWAAIANPGTVWAAGKLAYDRSDPVYKWVQRCRAQLLNPPVDWSSQIVFRGIANRAALEAVSKEFLRRYETARIWAETPHGKVLALPFGNVNITIQQSGDRDLAFGQFVDELGDTDASLVLEFSQVQSSYRNSVQIVEHHLVHLIEAARDIARPTSGKYGIRARFPGINPYFGLYVRRLGPTDLVSFDCDFHEKVAGATQDVVVRKNSLEIVTDHVGAFGFLTRRYLAIR